MFNWSPNFIGAKYSGKFVEFPDYDPKCENDASWGINTNKFFDCAHSKVGYLKLAVNIEFKNKHPKGYKMLKKMNFSTSDIETMSNYVETEKMEISLAAQTWLKNNSN